MNEMASVAVSSTLDIIRMDLDDLTIDWAKGGGSALCVYNIITDEAGVLR